MLIHIGVQALEHVLLTHQRWTRNQCMCGQTSDGDSHVEHVVEMIRQAEQG